MQVAQMRPRTGLKYPRCELVLDQEGVRNAHVRLNRGFGFPWPIRRPLTAAKWQ